MTKFFEKFTAALAAMLIATATLIPVVTVPPVQGALFISPAIA